MRATRCGPVHAAISSVEPHIPLSKQCAGVGNAASRPAAAAAVGVGTAAERSPSADDLFVGDERSVILFDGVCNFCNAGVQFVLRYDSVGYASFLPPSLTLGVYACPSPGSPTWL